MFCSSCGTELPDDASFCLKCGRPQKQSATRSSPTTEYEFCTLQIVAAGWNDLKWEVWARNSKIAQSNKFRVDRGLLRGPDVEIARQKNLELVSQLISQGWKVFTTNDQGHVVAMMKPKK